MQPNARSIVPSLWEGTVIISIGYITSRKEPRFDWFFESLAVQLQPTDDIELILVDFFAQEGDGWTSADVGTRGTEVMKAQTKAGLKCPVIWTPPKPTVWQGPYRLTKDQWWAAANSRNTALCWSAGDYWVNVDDRCVLLPGWMDAVREAKAGNYAVCGPYQKRTSVTVENGLIKNAGIVTGEDNRTAYVRQYYDIHQHLRNPFSAPGSWWYGCSTGIPIEWALKVNGYPEDVCDGLGSEDSLFGILLQNNNLPIYFDERMAIVEDRSPEFIGTTMRREDKGEIGTPRDKSHSALNRIQTSKVSMNSYDIRQLRNNMLQGKPWPKPTALAYDWFDKQPINQM